MKKKIILTVFTIIIAIIALAIFSNNVEASTTYNSEISYDENYDGTVTVNANGKYIESATIPSTINGKKVTNIGDFSDCKYLKTVTLPSGIETIEYGAFRGCTSLTTINIPGTVTTIEDYAFSDCSSLTQITITSKVEKLTRGTFEGCTKLKNVTLANGLNEIERETFKDCTSLSKITIPPSVKTIGWGAFMNCTSLTSITIPETVTKLNGNWYQEGIFSGCTSLKTAYINAKAENIPEGMFYNCTALTTVTFSDSFKTMNDSVFEGCTSLRNITLPANLTNIGEKTFKNCTNLVTVNIGDYVEKIGNEAFTNCKSIQTLKFPYSLKTIESDNYIASYSRGAFVGCTSLRTVYFTKSIQTINESAFKDLTNLTFYGYAGTAAKYYAQEKEIKFIECTPVSSIKISGATSVLKGSTIKLSTTISPSNAYNKNIKWTSSNSGVATVSSDGTVKGVTSGTVTITAMAKDGTGVKATYNVKVTLTELPFRDVNITNWYYNSVKYCYDNGIIMGTTNETFSPNTNVTRGNLVTILWRMEGSPKVGGNISFPDVKESDYFYEAVKWAQKSGVVHGYDTGKFGPNNNISREQLATILNNYAKYKKKDTKAQADLTKFTDNKKISSYAREGVAWAVAKKVMSGKVNGTMVDPQGKASRAEAAAMIQNYCNYVGR